MKLDGLNILFVDAETFYDSKLYTLKKSSVTEYIRDDKFKCHGFGFCGLDDEPVWIKSEELPVFLRTIDWSKTAVVAHNTKFDGSILAWRYGVQPALWIDTVSMAKAVLGAAVPSFSLRVLGERYGSVQKGEMKTDGIRDLSPAQDAELATYNRGDLIICRDLFKKFRPDFPASQYGPMDWTIRCATEPILEINTVLASEISVFEEKRRNEIIAASGIEKTELSSNPKFAVLLEKSGFECPTKTSPRTKKEIPALALGDESFLEMLESDNDSLRALCEARVAAKSTLLTTRCAKLARVGATGSWPFDVQFSGAKQTHRYSGGPAAGGNPQNFSQCQDPDGHKADPAHVCSARIRRCVVSPAGHSLVVGDFSRVECVITAYLSGDKHMIASLQPGHDPYCEFGTKHYGRLITKANILERKFAKTAVLGLGYCMGPTKFAKNVRVKTGQEIDDATAKKAVFLFRMMYPGIEKMWGYLQSLLPRMLAGEKGALLNLPAVRYDGPKFILPSGLEIRYTGLKATPGGRHGTEWSYVGFRDKSQTPQVVNIYGGKMLENLAQALAGEICKEAIERLKNDAPTVGMVHDEILQVVYEGWEEDAAENMKQKMSQSPAWWPSLCLDAEVGYGKNWLDAKC